MPETFNTLATGQSTPITSNASSSTNNLVHLYRKAFPTPTPLQCTHRSSRKNETHIIVKASSQHVFAPFSLSPSPLGP